MQRSKHLITDGPFPGRSGQRERLVGEGLARSRGLGRPPQQFNGVNLGDVSGDGDVNAGDASLVKQFVNGNTSLTDAQKTRADVDGDGQVTANDADLILKYAVESIDTFPIQSQNGGGGGNGNGELPVKTGQNRMIAGVPNSAVYVGGGLLAVAAIALLSR